MYARDEWPRRGVACGRFGDALERRRETIERRGDQRRAPRRDALFDEELVEPVPVTVARARDVDVVDAVDLNVDESRHDRAIGCRRGRRQRITGDDAPPVEADAYRSDDAVGRDGSGGDNVLHV